MSESQRRPAAEADLLDTAITDALADMVAVPDSHGVRAAVQRSARRRRLRNRAASALAVIVALGGLGAVLNRVSTSNSVPVAGPATTAAPDAATVPASGSAPTSQPGAATRPLALGEWVDGLRTPVVFLNWQWSPATLTDAAVEDVTRPTVERLSDLGYPTDPETIRVGNLSACLGPNHEYLDDPRGELVVGVAIPFATITDAETFALAWGAGADVDLIWVACADPSAVAPPAPASPGGATP